MPADYKHGSYITQKSSVASIGESVSGMQVVIGTAPIHLLDNPESAVNKPIICFNINDVIDKLGYSKNPQFTINQSAYFTFEKYRVAPAVFINVLDPTKHTEEKTTTLTLSRYGTALADDGVLRKSLVLSSVNGEIVYEEDIDYTLALDSDNKTVINALRTSEKLTPTSEVKVTYNILQPSAVTEAEIIGGYDSDTGVATGIELIRKVYPLFGVRPDIVIAPGFSKAPIVAALLQAKMANINDSFNSMTFLDFDTKAVKTADDAKIWKSDNGYTDKRAIGLWPCVKDNGRIYFYSAALGAYASYLISQDEDGIPYISPSNEKLNVDAIVLEDGTEVLLEIGEANKLNGLGIVTLLNWAGAIRSWGNNTLAFPESKAPEDRFINVRSVFDWWGNTFIEKHFDKIDGNGNLRSVEIIVDEENIRANAFASSGKIAGASIEFLAEDNPAEDIQAGKFQFRQRIGAFGPFENLVNVIEYDSSITAAALTIGGDE